MHRRSGSVPAYAQCVPANLPPDYYAAESADNFTMYYRTNDGQVGDIVLTGRKGSKGKTYDQVDANYKKPLNFWAKCRFHLATS